MPKTRSASSKKKKRRKRKRVARPYQTDKHSRAKRNYFKRRHRASQMHGHHKRARDEAELTNYLLNQILKTAASTDEKPYQYHPRHHSRDPEYDFHNPRTQEFKQGFAAPDVNFWRPQGESMPPHRANFPTWRPEWVHTYGHPHAG